MSTYWGYHLCINARGASLAAISDASNIEKFTKDLVKRIDMIAYGEPQIVHFGSGNKAGYTLVQLIETSNICAHFVEDDGYETDTGSYYFDCFSCKPFDINEVIKCCREYFKNESEQISYITRQA